MTQFSSKPDRLIFAVSDEGSDSGSGPMLQRNNRPSCPHSKLYSLNILLESKKDPTLLNEIVKGFVYSIRAVD